MTLRIFQSVVKQEIHPSEIQLIKERKEAVMTVAECPERLGLTMTDSVKQQLSNIRAILTLTDNVSSVVLDKFNLKNAAPLCMMFAKSPIGRIVIGLASRSASL